MLVINFLSRLFIVDIFLVDRFLVDMFLAGAFLVGPFLVGKFVFSNDNSGGTNHLVFNGSNGIEFPNATTHFLCFRFKVQLRPVSLVA